MMPPNTPTTRTLASTSLWLIGSFSGLLFLQQHVLNGLASIWRHFFQQPLLLVWLNQIVFLPGVWLHESSHWLFAKLLGVPTFDFSLLPQQLPDGSIRMGYVTVAQTDPLRAALVGAAPLFGGVLAVWAIGNWRFNLAAVGQALLAGAFRQAWQLARLPRWDTLLWAYLLFAISNTMLPRPTRLAGGTGLAGRCGDRVISIALGQNSLECGGARVTTPSVTARQYLHCDLRCQSCGLGGDERGALVFGALKLPLNAAIKPINNSTKIANANSLYKPDSKNSANPPNNKQNSQ
jgi:hypothetical protein